MLILFTIGVLLYALGVRVAAWFGNAKAKQWVEGRKKHGSLSIKGGLTKLKTAFRRAQRPEKAEAPEPGVAEHCRSVEGPTTPTEQWIWFHAASLGEFEQGRPVIEAIKERHPQYKISLTFFSPSGYEIRKDYPLADEVMYLPIDTPRNAKEWVAIQPSHPLSSPSPPGPSPSQHQSLFQSVSSSHEVGRVLEFQL